MTGMHSEVRWPAEFEPHAATVLAWPHNKEDWPGKIAATRWAFLEFVRHVTLSEPLYLVVPGEKDEARLRKTLADAHVSRDRVTFLRANLDRGWMRDCMPAVVWRGGRLEAVRFGFNAWAKYDNWQLDAAFPPQFCDAVDMPMITVERAGVRVVLEGGAIDGNGQGTLLTTEECLLDPETQVRNAGWTRADYEAMFTDTLGVQQVIWLGNGIAGDDTHGHVDDLCRFVNADTVVLCREDNPADANYSALEENRERLERVRLANGKSLNVIALPMPARLFFRGLRLPASYANFYITNEAVLVPTFNDPNDRVALGILAECFPDRRIVGIHAVDLVWGFGTLHCLSHEIPLAQGT
jgi:agmatine deiminase